MNLIEQIIIALTDSNIPLQDTLLKLKIFAQKINNAELLNLVNSELEGYDKNPVPNYRIIRNPIIGSVANRASQYKNINLPVMHLDKDLRELIGTCEMNQSVAILEEFLNINDNDFSLHKTIPPEFFTLLSQGFQSSHQVYSAKMPISKGDIRGILTRVRSALLDIMMQVEKSISSDCSIQLFKDTDNKTINEINNIVNNNIQNIFTSKDESVQNIKIEQETQSK